ncbi:conserved hypothetical protein [metagenome]|uniref:Uncharacterized protein n=1 Tax=metagenome TaxID=256318 RepID=A0A2P2C018_9ZZZZ
MSRERARRRAEREREQAATQARLAEEAQRRARREARWGALTSWLPRPGKGPTGLLAQRRRHELTITVILLLLVNLVVWLAFPDWAPRILALMVSLLGAPVVHLLLFRRR